MAHSNEERIMKQQDNLFRLMSRYHAQLLLLQGRFDDHRATYDKMLAEQKATNEKLSALIEKHEGRFKFYAGFAACLTLVGALMGWMADKLIQNWQALSILKSR